MANNLYRQFEKATTKIPYQFYNRRPGIDYGWLEVVTGNMFSGKSEHLIMSYYDILQADQFYVRSAQREGMEVAYRRVKAYKHAADTRYGEEDKIVAHSGLSMTCQAVHSVKELVESIEGEGIHVALVDEVQFFQERDDKGSFEIVKAALALLREKRFLLFAGLDKDFRGMPFGPMGELLAIADAKPYYVSTCAVCGAPATLPQRLINNRPARFDDPVVMVGASETYEPRCRSCHEIDMGEEKSDVREGRRKGKEPKFRL
ncbi:Thymidine kinase [[Clostridium] ultunense Esp]|nr:Thymidine kinase [[Clostridium] ultunense Esp]